VDRVRTFGRADDALADVITLRRSPAHRARLALDEQTENRTTTVRVLRAIDDLSPNGPPGIGDVAERLDMEHSNTSRTVETLVQEGLVVNNRSVADARKSELRFTQQGEDAVRAMKIRRAQVHAELIAEWTDEEITAFTSLLEKLRDSYQKLIDE